MTESMTTYASYAMIINICWGITDD